MLFRNILFVVGYFRRVSDDYISSWKSMSCTSTVKQRIVLVWPSSIHFKGHFSIHAGMCMLGFHTQTQR